MIHKLYYCIDVEKDLLCFTNMGGVLRTDNPNKAEFKIKGAWEDTWEVKMNKDRFVIKEFNLSDNI